MHYYKSQGVIENQNYYLKVQLIYYNVKLH
jgi:hypothetical protein